VIEREYRCLSIYSRGHQCILHCGDYGNKSLSTITGMGGCSGANSHPKYSINAPLHFGCESALIIFFNMIRLLT
jgi:hypothetical protein